MRIMEIVIKFVESNEISHLNLLHIYIPFFFFCLNLFLFFYSFFFLLNIDNTKLETDQIRADPIRNFWKMGISGIFFFFVILISVIANYTFFNIVL